jgi:pimeloyl-ACP methyl ester carboxylesterase
MRRTIISVWRAAWVMAAVLAWAATGADAADGYVDAKGTRIHYTDEGQGEPVVLIHGFAIHSGTQWVLPGVQKMLAKEYRVICIDNRGHGLSDKPHDPKLYGMEMVEDIVRLLDHLRIERAHLVGYSMGGLIALKFVTLHPERVRSATICAMGLLRPNKEPFMAALADSLASGKGFAPLLIALAPPGRPKPTEAQMELTNRFLTAGNDVRAMAALIRAALDPRLDMTDADIKAIQVPIIAIVGQEDAFKVHVAALKTLLPRMEVVTVPGGDHFNTVFKPLFLKSVRKFLAANREASAEKAIEQEAVP